MELSSVWADGADAADGVDATRLQCSAPEHQVSFEGLAIGPLRAGSVDCSLRDVIAVTRVEVEAFASHPWHGELK